MKFSLIVVTTNRLLLSERLFISLAGQTYKNFEVIFVYGRECETEAQTLASNYTTSLDIRTLASTDHCLSRSRNLALPLVTGDVIAFPDDDCVYEPDTLAQCAAVFEKYSTLSVLAARVLDLNEMAPPAALTTVRKLNHLSIFQHSISFAQFHKRESVRAIGGFDEDLGIGCSTVYQSGEDTDYMLRALESGSILAYAPAILIRHPAVNLRDANLREKVRAYAQGRMQLLRKHRLPTWIIILNVIHPLVCIPAELINVCLSVIRYRWNMFIARLGELL